MHYIDESKEEYHNIVAELIARGYADYNPIADSVLFAYDDSDLTEMFLKKLFGDKYEEYKNREDNEIKE